MNVLAVISPGLKILFERVGKPKVINRPDFFRFDGTGAVIGHQEGRFFHGRATSRG